MSPFRQAQGKLFKLRGFLTGRLDAFLPSPSSGFAAGILFGVRSGIPREVTDDFKRAGLTHILALSGFNIVILIAFIENFLVFFAEKNRECIIPRIYFCFYFNGWSGSIRRSGSNYGFSFRLLQKCLGGIPPVCVCFL